MLISGYDSIFTKIDEHVDFTNSVYSRIDDFCPCMKLPTISGQKWWYFPEYRWHVLSRTAVNVTICLRWIETSESFLLHFCRRSRNWYLKGANLHYYFCFSVEKYGFDMRIMKSEISKSNFKSFISVLINTC